MRVDLPHLADTADGPLLARTLVAHLGRDGARRGILVLYADQDPRGQDGAAQLAARHFREAAADALGDVLVWVVTPAGYLSLDCVEDCCPPGGRPLRTSTRRRWAPRWCWPAPPWRTRGRTSPGSVRSTETSGAPSPASAAGGSAGARRPWSRAPTRRAGGGRTRSRPGGRRSRSSKPANPDPAGRRGGASRPVSPTAACGTGSSSRWSRNLGPARAVCPHRAVDT